ncbi:hypothetical protein C8J56DRAFT_887213 [Mycena floridula]|nr:hypothetical protein C8J56DRAFT_887213 [Mycena floridula]
MVVKNNEDIKDFLQMIHALVEFKTHASQAPSLPSSSISCLEEIGKILDESRVNLDQLVSNTSRARKFLHSCQIESLLVKCKEDLVLKIQLLQSLDLDALGRQQIKAVSEACDQARRLEADAFQTSQEQGQQFSETQHHISCLESGVLHLRNETLQRFDFTLRDIDQMQSVLTSVQQQLHNVSTSVFDVQSSMARFQQDLQVVSANMMRFQTRYEEDHGDLYARYTWDSLEYDPPIKADTTSGDIKPVLLIRNGKELYPCKGRPIRVIEHRNTPAIFKKNLKIFQSEFVFSANLMPLHNSANYRVYRQCDSFLFRYLSSSSPFCDGYGESVGLLVFDCPPVECPYTDFKKSLDLACFLTSISARGLECSQWQIEPYATEHWVMFRLSPPELESKNPYHLKLRQDMDGSIYQALSHNFQQADLEPAVVRCETFSFADWSQVRIGDIFDKSFQHPLHFQAKSEHSLLSVAAWSLRPCQIPSKKWVSNRICRPWHVRKPAGQDIKCRQCPTLDWVIDPAGLGSDCAKRATMRIGGKDEGKRITHIFMSPEDPQSIRAKFLDSLGRCLLQQSTVSWPLCLVVGFEVSSYFHYEHRRNMHLKGPFHCFVRPFDIHSLSEAGGHWSTDPNDWPASSKPSFSVTILHILTKALFRIGCALPGLFITVSVPALRWTEKFPCQSYVPEIGEIGEKANWKLKAHNCSLQAKSCPGVQHIERSVFGTSYLVCYESHSCPL